MSEYGDKARSLGFARKRGGDHVKPVQNQNDGSQAGYEVEHWDDSQDAVAQPKSVKLKVREES